MRPALSDRFLEHAERQASAPALIWHGRATTYGGLARLARDAMRRVEALGPGEGRPVAVLARKSPETIALVLGCLMSRRPLLLPSPDLPRDTLRRLLEQAGCDRVLSPATAGPALVARGPEPSGALADDVALMLTTSGSTGVPKVVPLTHEAIRRFTDWAAARFDIQAGTTVLNYAPLNFDLCLLDLWTTLEHGGCVALVDQDRATRPGHLRELLTAHDVQVVQGVPMLYRLLLDAGGPGFERVAHAIVTGDRMPAPAVAALPGRFPRARIYNVYGCTETNDSFIHELDVSRPPAGPMPIGKPLPGVDVLILAPDGRVAEGEGGGELAVATPFQTPGYLEAGLNDGRFMRHPERSDGPTYFRTGDLVRRGRDGVVTLEGRLDDVVKVRGVRVCLPVVEDVLAQHPHVVEAAVVAVPDELQGHRLHAVVRRSEGSDLNSLSIRRHCALSLAPAGIPSTVEVVTTALPRTTTGKVDRRRTHPNRTKEQPR